MFQLFKRKNEKRTFALPQNLNVKDSIWEQQVSEELKEYLINKKCFSGTA